jgi:hypothetical protein
MVVVMHTLTSKRLAEPFCLVEEGLAILDEDDPDHEWSSEVLNVLVAMQCYTEN